MPSDPDIQATRGHLSAGSYVLLGPQKRLTGFFASLSGRSSESEERIRALVGLTRCVEWAVALLGLTITYPASCPHSVLASPPPPPRRSSSSEGSGHAAGPPLGVKSAAAALAACPFATGAALVTTCPAVYSLAGGAAAAVRFGMCEMAGLGLHHVTPNVHHDPATKSICVFTGAQRSLAATHPRSRLHLQPACMSGAGSTPSIGLALGSPCTASAPGSPSTHLALSAPDAATHRHPACRPPAKPGRAG